MSWPSVGTLTRKVPDSASQVCLRMSVSEGAPKSQINSGSDAYPSAENFDCGLELEVEESVEDADTELSAFRLGVPKPESKGRKVE
ncbi:uncharacterized protein N7515_001039 [Penicillium bovifimosum]|uniref:Uncharacterized protein n=1 Tax=Penicillium bovifimosum TaxID=126998 RepID=A0A9W9HIN5_9EURO|nr:uncharacterized protein N7515_001039 [Penicillium bovifimosum]KAJ5146475.1 hypothetical protein N7515_001039 [Penicillium bovifimosum]